MSVSIIGISVRLPQCNSVQAFWNQACVGEPLFQRLDLNALEEYGVPRNVLAHRDYVPVRGVLDDALCFDSAFFNINMREAELTDPQHRLMLEVGWQALEDAGLSVAKSRRIGVFASKGGNSYMRALLASGRLDADSLEIAIHGNDADFVASLLAYKLDLQGPVMTVQSACSSSLLGVHLARNALLSHECDHALIVAAGVPFPQAGYTYIEGGIRSRQGVCRPFDDAADGVLEGSGVVAVVLCRTGEVEPDAEPAYATIVASATNNDGNKKVGYAAPSLHGQEAVIAEALKVAGTEASSIRFLETHGTGTHLGDAIEWTAAENAYARAGAGRKQIAIGATKATLGHLDAASGLIGLVKAALVVRNHMIPPLTGFHSLNRMFDGNSSVLYVPTKQEALPATDIQKAAVSSFGVGGSNVHMVLESSATVVKNKVAAARPHCIVLSARDPEALVRQERQLVAFLESNPEILLEELAHTLAHRRAVHPYRTAYWADTVESLTRKLAAPKGEAIQATGRDIVLAFPGQGTQFAGMALPFANAFSDFCEKVEAILRFWTSNFADTVRKALFEPNFSAAALAQTALAQPCLFAVELAAAQCLYDRGVRPKGIIGHSLGELVGLTAAEVLTVAEAADFIRIRGDAMQRCPPGAMLSVQTDAQTIATAIAGFDGTVWVAAVNGTHSITLAGSADHLTRFAEIYRKTFDCQLLKSVRGFHSPMIQDCYADLALKSQSMTTTAARFPVYLGHGGITLSRNQDLPAGYLADQAINPVRFVDSLDRLRRDLSNPFVIEVGPGTVLSGLCLAQDFPAIPLVPSRRSTDTEQCMQALCTLWSEGAVDLTLAGFVPNSRAIHIPLYPFKGPEVFFPPLARFAPSAWEPRILNTQSPADVLTQTWNEFLGLTDPKMESNMYDLGGDSFLIIRMVSRLRELLHIDLTAREVMACPTFGEQLTLLKQSCGVSSDVD